MALESKRTRFYKALIETIINVIGNTAGIWLTYIIAVLFFGGIIKTEWQGIQYFLYDGSLLILTFSFLTSVIIVSFQGYSINRYNSLAFLLFFLSAILYAKHLGMNGNSSLGKWLWIPSVLSIILLFFALYSQRFVGVPRWMNRVYTSAATYKTYDIFIAYAIAGNKNSTQRKKIKEEIFQIESILKDLGYNNIFNADNHILAGQFDDEYPPPSVAASIDFQAINNSKNFILYYPEQTPTSAILELGYSLKEGDNVLIITPKIEILPFLVRGLESISDKVKYLEYNNNFSYIETILKENHLLYFGKRT